MVARFGKKLVESGFTSVAKSRKNLAYPTKLDAKLDKLKTDISSKENQLKKLLEKLRTPLFRQAGADTIIFGTFGEHSLATTSRVTKPTRCVGSWLCNAFINIIGATCVSS